MWCQGLTTPTRGRPGPGASLCGMQRAWCRGSPRSQHLQQLLPALPLPRPARSRAPRTREGDSRCGLQQNIDFPRGRAGGRPCPSLDVLPQRRTARLWDREAARDPGPARPSGEGGTQPGREESGGEGNAAPTGPGTSRPPQAGSGGAQSLPEAAVHRGASRAGPLSRTERRKRPPVPFPSVPREAAERSVEANERQRLEEGMRCETH